MSRLVTLICIFHSLTIPRPLEGVRADIESEHAFELDDADNFSSLENFSDDDFLDEEWDTNPSSQAEDQESSNVSGISLFTPLTSPNVSEHSPRESNIGYGLRLRFATVLSLLDRGKTMHYLQAASKVAKVSLLEDVRQNLLSHGDCAVNVDGDRIGCRAGCDCGWAGRCYPFHTEVAEGASTVKTDVGICGLGIVLYVTISFFIIVFILSCVILLRIFVQHREPLFPPMPMSASAGKLTSAAATGKKKASADSPKPTWSSPPPSTVKEHETKDLKEAKESTEAKESKS